MTPVISVLAYLDPGEPDKGGLSTLGVVGIVVGSVLLVVMVSVLALRLYRRRG